MTLTRIGLGITGVLLAIFLQAWGLPVFLTISLLLGWIIERGKDHRQVRKSGIYIGHLTILYLCLFIMIIIADLINQLTTQFLSDWDKISLLKVSLTDRTLPENGVFHRKSIKLAMNFTAIIVPVLVAMSYHELISAFPKRTHFLPRIVYAGLFLFCAIFPLWLMGVYGLSTFHTNAAIFTFYFLQSIILLFLFRQL